MKHVTVQLDLSASCAYVQSDKQYSSAVVGSIGIGIASVDWALTCIFGVTCGSEVEVSELGSVVSSAFYLWEEPLQQEWMLSVVIKCQKMFQLEYVDCNEM